MLLLSWHVCLVSELGKPRVFASAAGTHLLQTRGHPLYILVAICALVSSFILLAYGAPARADSRACGAQRDMLGVLLFHMLHFALVTNPAQRDAVLRSGYLWVYGIVCLAHTVYYVFAPKRCAGSCAASRAEAHACCVGMCMVSDSGRGCVCWYALFVRLDSQPGGRRLLSLLRQPKLRLAVRRANPATLMKTPPARRPGTCTARASWSCWRSAC